MQRADDAAGAGGAQLLLRRTLHLSAVSSDPMNFCLRRRSAARLRERHRPAGLAGAVQAKAENARGSGGAGMCSDARPSQPSPACSKFLFVDSVYLTPSCAGLRGGLKGALATSSLHSAKGGATWPGFRSRHGACMQGATVGS